MIVRQRHDNVGTNALLERFTKNGKNKGKGKKEKRKKKKKKKKEKMTGVVQDGEGGYAGGRGGNSWLSTFERLDASVYDSSDLLGKTVMRRQTLKVTMTKLYSSDQHQKMMNRLVELFFYYGSIAMSS